MRVLEPWMWRSSNGPVQTRRQKTCCITPVDQHNQAFIFGCNYSLTTSNGLGSSHNLVTFDLRGVNNSGIDLTCFGDQKANRGLYDTALSRSSTYNSQEQLADRFVHDKGYSQW